jgi:cobalamin-dependent methionine synthase I
VVGLFPANRVGDDIEIYRDETRTHVLTVSHHLRQQTESRLSPTTALPILSRRS